MIVKDPVCGMEIEASAAKLKEDYEGDTYHFCSKGCHAKFREAPERYVRAARGAESTGPSAFQRKDN